MKLGLVIDARRGPYFALSKFPALVEVQRNNSWVKSFFMYLVELAALDERIWSKFESEEILEGISLFMMNDIDWIK